MLATEMQTLMTHQRRIEEIDRAIKKAQNFFDHKAFLADENGKNVLLTTTELYKLREAEEQAILRARQ